MTHGFSLPLAGLEPAPAPAKQPQSKIILSLGCGCEVKADNQGYRIGAFVICPNCGTGMRIDGIRRVGAVQDEPSAG